MFSRAFFEELADALAGFLPPELRGFCGRPSSRNLKVWFGDEPREHYEVQVLPRGRLEVGFHAEHADPDRNEAVIERLGRGRKRLGREAEAGAFVGGGRPWRRLSEVWEPDGLAPEGVVIEAAERLADYIRTLEPLRT